ncbi:MAG: SGNH/GDSL hydrolase family protein [Hyphomicrobiaceae bacterium]|nr:SGNH/GDSL hydrolase family protein [Hyphomicrobiaceae bacterium]
MKLWPVFAVFLALSTARTAADDATVKASVTPSVFEATIGAGLGPVSLPSLPPTLSNDCTTRKLAGDNFRRPLRGLRRAVRNKRAPKVLAIGSSSTVGVGASRPSNAYIAKLESGLERMFVGLDFDVVGRGMSGEVAEGQSARMKDTIADVKPDLVLWQVGTNDAIRHIDLDSFKQCLRRTLTWLHENNFDVVLVDPQYGDALVKDDYYEKVVTAVAEIAQEHRVLLVDRFYAMQELSRQRGDAFYLTNDNLHLNDNGHRCMAEQLARAIVAGVLLAEADTKSPALTQPPVAATR